MADKEQEGLVRLERRSNLTIKRLQGRVRPEVRQDQLVIWENTATTASTFRILFRSINGKRYEISGSYEV